MKIPQILILFVGVALLTSLVTQTTDPIPEHETFTIQSDLLGETRTINVWIPTSYKTEATKLPVMYMLDGGLQEDFPHVAATVEAMIAAQKIKPIILVGIENTQRRRDLTGFTSVEKDKEIAPIVGGSEKFRNFISQELFPEIEKRYQTTSERTIIGESLAGLFVIETMFLKPEMFDRYIAFDPSLWWNDMYLLKSGEEHLSHFPKSQKTLWFAGSSAKDIYKNTQKLAQLFQEHNIPNLTWNYSPEKKEKHNTIFRATKEKAISWALNH